MGNRCSTTKQSKSKKSIKPSKHDVIAQVLHFIHYIEDLAAMPKGLRPNFDVGVAQKKCEQVKQILENLEDI